MAKRRTKKAEAAGAPIGTAAGTGHEKERETKEPEKGGSDAAAAVAAGDVVISAPVHCDGCARKLRRSLERLDGIGEVSVDCRSNTVVVSGPKAVGNAAEAVGIVERKTGEKATLVSPPPEKLPSSPAAKRAGTKKDGADEDMADDIADLDMDMVVVLRINLHCDGCSEEIKRRILRINGVEEVVPLLKSSQVMVKGTVEPATLVGFIHRCTGRRAAILRAEPLDQQPAAKAPPTDAPLAEAEAKQQDPADKPGEGNKGHASGEKDEAPQNEKKGGEEDGNADDEKPDGGDGIEDHGTQLDGQDRNDGRDGIVVEDHKKDDRLFTVPLPAGAVTVAPEMALNRLNPYYTYPPYPYAHLHHYYQCPPPYPYACSPAMFGYPHYAPEDFSEENPNACSIL